MRALVCHAYGPIASLKLEDVPKPEPAAGEDVRRRGPRGQRGRRARMELVAVAGQQQTPAGMHVPGERKQAHGGILDPRFAQFHTRGCLTTAGGVKAWSPH